MHTRQQGVPGKGAFLTPQKLALGASCMAALPASLLCPEEWLACEERHRLGLRGFTDVASVL